METLGDKFKKFFRNIAEKLGFKKNELLNEGKTNDIKNSKEYNELKEDIKGADSKDIENVLEEKDVRDEAENLIGKENAEELTAHGKFAKELSDHANEFNPGGMKKEDAIMQILEEKGLNPEFKNNPAAKQKISNIVEKILYNEGIKNITKDNLEDVKSKIFDRYASEFKEFRQNNINGPKDQIAIEISEDGSLIVTTNTKNENTVESENQYFKMKDGKFLHTRADKFSLGNNGLYDHKVNNVREGVCYDENGVAMKRYISSNIVDRNDKLISDGDRICITRNSDLVTGYVLSDNAGLSGIEQGEKFLSDNSLHIEDQFTRNPGIYQYAAANVPINTENPEQLFLSGGSTSLKDLKSTKEKNWENGYIGDEPRFNESNPEKEEMYEKQQNWIKIAFEESCKKSPKFKKLAEERGLIEPEQSQELE